MRNPPAANRRLLALALTLSAATTPALADCQLIATAVLPLQMNAGVMTIPATVNDTPQTLVFDTGLLDTTLNYPAAQRLGISLSLLDSGAYIRGGYRQAWSGHAASFGFGNMKDHDIPLAAANLWQPADLPNVDGALGMDMLTTADMDIDTKSHTLTIMQAQGNCLRPTVSLEQPLFIAPLNLIQDNQQIAVTVALDGHRFKALLDSGIPHTAIYRTAAAASGADLSDIHPTATRPSFDQVTQEPPLKTIRFASFTIGSLQLHDIPVDILNQPDPGVDRMRAGSMLVTTDNDAPGGEEVLIGADLMQRVHFWVSRSSGNLVMQLIQ